MGYERFPADFFSCPFLAVSQLSRSCQTVAPLSTPPIPSDGKILPESMSRDSLLQSEPDRLPVPNPCQHDAATRFWQENVGILHSMKQRNHSS
jgi:hypothetical protein